MLLTKEPDIKIGPTDFTDKIVADNITLVKRRSGEPQKWDFEFFENKAAFSVASNTKMLPE